MTFLPRWIFLATRHFFFSSCGEPKLKREIKADDDEL